MKSASIEVQVASIDADGLGVGRYESRTVHVKGAAPLADGTPVVSRVRIVKRRGGQWYGVALGADTTPCRAYPICGGCSMMHLEPRQQLHLKTTRVLALLEAGHVRPDSVEAPCAGPLYHYRRRARLGVRHLARDGETLVGFRESFGSRVARANACLVLAEPLAAAFPSISAALTTLTVRARVPQVELSAGDANGALVLRHLEPIGEEDRHRLRELGYRTGLEVLLQPAGEDSVACLDGAAPTSLSYRLDAFGLSLEFAPLDFVQVNARVNHALVTVALAWLRPRADERIVDLFCGIGNFTLPIACRGAGVLGVEASAKAVARARSNASRNGLGTRADFMAADLYDRPGPALQDALLGAAGALVDPPRSGIGALAPLLERSAVARLVYVSCHPESFARDAAALVAAGFLLRRIATFDMFPHTAHIETLALFERR